MPRAGDVIAERFRLEEELGAGAMGSVWRATHLALQTSVAIKLIRAEAARNPEAHVRFEREAMIAARLSSAHIVRALDHGRHGEVPYIVMEYLEGETLRSRLDARRRLSLTETSKVVRHVARALTAAHEAGLVHRDVKPENIFVSREDDEEIFKVLDFGVAKITDELARRGVDPTRTGTLLGTPFYLSPEQARGLKTLDHRADLWSLGVVTYECLTGRRPFAGRAIGPLIAQILHGQVPSLRDATGDDGFSRELDAWMARALAREPAERFSSAREMADAFNVAAGTGDSFPIDSATSYTFPKATVVFEEAEPIDDLAATMALPDDGPGPVGGDTLALPDGLEPAPSDATASATSASASPSSARGKTSDAASLAQPWATEPKRSATPLAIGLTAVVVAAILAAGYVLVTDERANPPAAPVGSGEAPAPDVPTTSTAATEAPDDQAPEPEPDEAVVDPPAVPPPIPPAPYSLPPARPTPPPPVAPKAPGGSPPAPPAPAPPAPAPPAPPVPPAPPSPAPASPPASPPPAGQ